MSPIQLLTRLSPLLLAGSLACLGAEPSTEQGEDTQETETETETGESVDLQLSVEMAAHSYQCIDGCEGFYSDDWLSLSIRADPDSEPRSVELAYHGVTLQSSGGLFVSNPPLDLATVELVPGELVEVGFHVSRDGSCNNEVSWNDPMRALITVDGVELEVTGNSVGSGGWDC